jgi:hypothetical protein
MLEREGKKQKNGSFIGFLAVFDSFALSSDAMVHPHTHP